MNQNVHTEALVVQVNRSNNILIGMILSRKLQRSMLVALILNIISWKN